MTRPLKKILKIMAVEGRIRDGEKFLWAIKKNIQSLQEKAVFRIITGYDRPFVTSYFRFLRQNRLKSKNDIVFSSSSPRHFTSYSTSRFFYEAVLLSFLNNVYNNTICHIWVQSLSAYKWSCFMHERITFKVFIRGRKLKQFFSIHDF